MQTIASHNYYEHIDVLLKSNPNLSPKKIGVLLTADSLYKDIPENLTEFRQFYAHLDPNLVLDPGDRSTLQRIAYSNDSPSLTRQKLNLYINIKFNNINNHKSYEENMKKFVEYSMAASEVVEGILDIAGFPKEIVSVLAEKQEVKECTDFYSLVQLYRENHNPRVRYEILRKMGFILLIARINRNIYIKELDKKMEFISNALQDGLIREYREPIPYYFWLSAKNKVVFSTKNDYNLELSYKKNMEERTRLALHTHLMQKFESRPFRTKKGNEIIGMHIRNKMKKQGRDSYTSIVEKIVRKNLEFPSLVRDIIGVRMIVKNEEDIPNVINELESFLGGSSTRKKEKNTYHRFGRRTLSDYSSKEYFVWKAIYDMPLPQPSTEYLQRMIDLSKDNKELNSFIKEKFELCLSCPQDFLIEVQLQDISSYLQSIAKGSPTEHALLKRNQVRSNSFYKLFPQEIYETEIFDLKMKILNSRGASGKNVKNQ